MEGLCLVCKNTFPVLINNDDLPEEGEGELWADILIFLATLMSALIIGIGRLVIIILIGLLWINWK
jgi:hypothetical protein